MVLKKQKRSSLKTKKSSDSDLFITGKHITPYYVCVFVHTKTSIPAVKVFDYNNRILLGSVSYTSTTIKSSYQNLNTKKKIEKWLDYFTLR